MAARADGLAGAGPAVRPGPETLPDLFVVKATCAIVMLGSATTLLFGRGVVAIVQGVVGVLFSLEGYYGARKVDRRIIGFFLLYLAINTVASVIIGVTTLNGLHSGCAGAKNPDTCATTWRLYGLLMLTGSASLGAVFTMIVFISWRRLRKADRHRDMQDVELDEW